MKERFKKIIIQQYGAILNFSSFMAASSIFLFGIGRYRVILVYAAYSFLNFLLSIIKPGKKIKYIFLPATIIALYFDVARGQVFPVFKNYLLIALPVMLVADTLMRNYVNRFIEKIAEGQLFVVCPSCSYDNKNLVEKCTHCSYKKGDQLVFLATTKQEVNKIIPFKVLNMLRLPEGEDILFHKKIFRNMGIFKNGKRQVRKYFFITTNTLIFLDYFVTAKSWREKDTIPLSKIVSIEGKMKRIYISKKPFLIIKTSSNDIYEIVFSSFGKYREEITEIAHSIKKASPQVEIKIDLLVPENLWKEIWKLKI